MIVRFEELQPIPISPSVLVACGFILTDDKISKFWKLVIDRTAVISIEDDWSFGLNAENETSSQGFASPPDLCKYLHQLQNLYFSLTNTEIVYKQK